MADHNDVCPGCVHADGSECDVAPDHVFNGIQRHWFVQCVCDFCREPYTGDHSDGWCGQSCYFYDEYEESKRACSCCGNYGCEWGMWCN